MKSNGPGVLASLQPPVQTSTSGPSFSYNIMPQNTVGATSQHFQSSMNTLFIAPQEARTAISASPNLHVHPSSSSMWIPTAPAFPGRPVMPGTPSTSGLSGIPSSVTTSTSSSRAQFRQLTLPTAHIPYNSVIQQHFHPPYASRPTMPLPHQALWLHPPPHGGFQNPPFLPYPPVLPGQYIMPIRGVNLSSGTLPDSQPLVVHPHGPPGGISLSSTGPAQSISRSGMQAELPPPGIDHNKKMNADGGSTQG